MEVGLKKLCQYTLSTHYVNTSCQHTLSIHPVNPPAFPPLISISTYPINTPYLPHLVHALSSHPIYPPPFLPYQHTLGILYLEELLAIATRIESAPHAGTGAKTSGTAKATAERGGGGGGGGDGVYGGTTAVWRQLSKLYGALGDNDVLLGLAEKVIPSHLSPFLSHLHPRTPTLT